MSEPPELRRVLGAWDGALLTIGSVVGTGIFLTAGDVARVVPHPGLILAVWLAGGLLALAGALAYAELGAMFPRAGGLYTFLFEAWGPVWGFLYGWTCLAVIMTGGIAAIAAGFGEYLGTLIPWFSDARSVLGIQGPACAALLAILALTAANVAGVRAGAGVQNLLTVLKLGAIAAIVIAGWQAPARLASAGVAQETSGLLLPFGLAMIAALWTYDGWYALTFASGELRHPARDLPRGLLGGIAAITAVYLLLNAVYLRALSPSALAATPRAAEAAMLALVGPRAARLTSAAVALSSLGCLAATILYAARIYQPMAADGLFFLRISAIHPRFHTPAAALVLQGLWSGALVVSGSYTQLFTYATFGGLLFHVGAGLALFRLRAKRPDAPRPYRSWGYPWVPALFIAAMALVTVSTLFAAPRESLLGLGITAAGLPAYAWWRWRPGRPGATVR
jgi:APA family basic amino acid/polyamine antiporter